ncbi:heavy metal translocating P-type ATPase [Allopusillimonas ginsengisoli]|uniref:heavy metal translocating P-type ATPase n=1 Tax=Allopusillimonas ginsengisoli TaxID=453575 RepID=UPI0010C21047|nr:heavy metal translocating P-type ATPase [Allopusillimonas ginsengisoli]
MPADTHQHSHDPTPDCAQPAGVSFSCCPSDAPGRVHDHEHGAEDVANDHAGHVHATAGQSWYVLAGAGIAALAAEMSGWAGASDWAGLALALIAIAMSGLGVYRSGLVSLVRGDLNINALMSIAVTGAVLLGHWPEAAMVMVLFAIAEHIEERSLDRARHAVERLMQVAPATVSVQAGSGEWVQTPAVDVVSGSLLRVRPGERIGLDGHVVEGRSFVDQAPITGESIPVQKEMGDRVYAGTINGMAELQYRVDAVFRDTLLARIIHAVQQAQSTKAPTQRFIDRFARVYTPVVCLISLAVAVVPPLLIPGAMWADWAYKALVLLVIACPCALVISTPVAIVSGLAAAARHGILIKGGVFLEQGRKMSWLALDKTGTLTQGEPVLQQFALLDPAYDEAQCRRIAASLGARSDHPVSQALARSYKEDVQTVQDFRAISGAGVQGSLDGVTYTLASPSGAAALALHDKSESGVSLRHEGEEQTPASSVSSEDGAHDKMMYPHPIDLWQERGYTVTVLAVAGQLIAAFAVADSVRSGSREAVSSLHALGVRTVVLSGDNEAAVRHVAAEVGIDEAHGGLLPDDKLRILQQYASKGRVGMVGDGINDAPALASSDIGFAMGVMGSDIAIETADVALMDDDLRKIPQFLRLSRTTHVVLVQNISLALGIKLVFLVLTLAGLGTMWMAVFADVGASLLVVANSLRLLRK